MQRQHFPMTFDAFERLPRKPGWKYEYFNGEAVLSPKSLCVVTTVAVEPRTVRSRFLLRSAIPDDEGQLIDAYLEAFKDTVEYCDWPAEATERSARETIQQFFGGDRRQPHGASRLAVADERPEESRVLGAALVIEGRSGPVLDLLFSRPRWQRQGLATALVSAVLSRLHDEGARHLTSRYLLANEASRAWHQSFGFVDEPDLWVAQAYHRCARHAVWRAEQMGDVDERERTRLEKVALRWSREVERLERLADEEGFDAVLPWRRLDRHR